MPVHDLQLRAQSALVHVYICCMLGSLELQVLSATDQVKLQRCRAPCPGTCATSHALKRVSQGLQDPPGVCIVAAYNGTCISCPAVKKHLPTRQIAQLSCETMLLARGAACPMHIVLQLTLRQPLQWQSGIVAQSHTLASNFMTLVLSALCRAASCLQAEPPFTSLWSGAGIGHRRCAVVAGNPRHHAHQTLPGHRQSEHLQPAPRLARLPNPPHRPHESRRARVKLDARAAAAATTDQSHQHLSHRRTVARRRGSAPRIAGGGARPEQLIGVAAGGAGVHKPARALAIKGAWVPRHYQNRRNRGGRGWQEPAAVHVPAPHPGLHSSGAQARWCLLPGGCCAFGRACPVCSQCQAMLYVLFCCVTTNKQLASAPSSHPCPSQYASHRIAALLPMPATGHPTTTRALRSLSHSCPSTAPPAPLQIQT